MKISKKQARIRRHQRVRSSITGTPERPRVALFRSNKHIYAQVIDDTAGKTLAAVTTVSKEAAKKNSCNTASATELGKKLGVQLQQKGIDKVVFDRGGFLYHGVVKAFADGLRQADEKNHFHF